MAFESDPDDVLYDESGEGSETFEEARPAADASAFADDRLFGDATKNISSSKTPPAHEHPRPPRSKKKMLFVVLTLILAGAAYWMSVQEATTPPEIPSPSPPTTPPATTTPPDIPETTLTETPPALVIAFRNDSTMADCADVVAAQAEAFEDALIGLPHIATDWIDGRIGDRIAIQNASTLRAAYTRYRMSLNATPELTACPPDARDAVTNLADAVFYGQKAATSFIAYIRSGDSMGDRLWEEFESYSESVRMARDALAGVRAELNATLTVTSTTSTLPTTLTSIVDSTSTSLSTTTSIPEEAETCDDLCLIRGYAGGDCKKTRSICDIKGGAIPDNSMGFCRLAGTTGYCCCFAQADEGLITPGDDDD